MYMKFRLKVKRKNSTKVKALLAKHRCIYDRTEKWYSRKYEYSFYVSPSKYERVKQDLDQAMKEGLIAEVEEF